MIRIIVTLFKRSIQILCWLSDLNRPNTHDELVSCWRHIHIWADTVIQIQGGRMMENKALHSKRADSRQYEIPRQAQLNLYPRVSGARS